MLHRWHDCLGHVSIDTVKRMAHNNAVSGISVNSSPDFSSCAGCAHGKSHRLPFPKRLGERKRAKRPGEFFHSDISGPCK